MEEQEDARRPSRAIIPQVRLLYKLGALYDFIPLKTKARELGTIAER
jgi:hypothetical protein